MKQQVIWEVDLPALTVEDLFTAQGANYDQRTPSDRILEINHRILAEAIKLVHPLAIWNEVNIIGVEGQELILENGIRFTSTTLTKVAGSAEKLILLAMTIGSSLDAYFGRIRTLIPVTSGQCFGIIRTGFRHIRTPCRVNKLTGTL